MAKLELPPSINDARSRALLELIERIDRIDLGALLVYRLDSVPDSALSFLAWQFDILSPLWQLIAPLSRSVDALTDIDALVDIDTLTQGGADESAASAARRALLKMAIPLHRFRGTPWAVKTALETLGWTDVELLEGQSSWGGTEWPDESGWAVFRVMIRLAEGQPVETVGGETLVAAINFFKPARAWLDSVWFVPPALADGAPLPRDVLVIGGIAEVNNDTAPVPHQGAFSLTVTAAGVEDVYGPIVAVYDAHYRHSGIKYGAAQPNVADSALTINGDAVLQGG